jgi:hypothetical protein
MPQQQCQFSTQKTRMFREDSSLRTDGKRAFCRPLTFTTTITISKRILAFRPLITRTTTSSADTHTTTGTFALTASLLLSIERNNKRSTCNCHTVQPKLCPSAVHHQHTFVFFHLSFTLTQVHIPPLPKLSLTFVKSNDTDSRR